MVDSGLYETIENIIKATKIMALDNFKESEEVLQQLENAGFSRIDAEKLFFFIQLAFGRSFLLRFGIETIPNDFIVDTIDENQLNLSLQNEKFYNCAFAIAEKHFNEGYVPKEIFNKAALWSAELNAANSALKAGDEIRGGTLLTPKWYSTLKAKDWQDAINHQ